MPVADVNGTRLHYRLDGPQHGPVIMLSNSLGSDLTMWDSQIPALTEAGYLVLRYDSRGHGQSAVPQGPYTMDMLTADAVGLLDQLGLDRAVFCGLSKGGMVGQMLGARHSERLTALVLSSTAAFVGSPEVWDERIETVRQSGMEAVVEGTIDRWFTREGQQQMPDVVDKIRRMVLNTPVEGFCASCAAIRDMDLREAIGSITAPTQIMVGENDQGTPVSAAELIHQRISGSRLHVVKDGAHLINVEKAAEFNRTLLGFLNPSQA